MITLNDNFVKESIKDVSVKPAKKGASELAAGWQGKGAYTGVDNWRDITLAEGKYVVGGYTRPIKLLYNIKWS